MKPRKLKTDQLRGLKREAAPKPRQCRICLHITDELEEGICSDRKVCEQRQPLLLPPGNEL